MALLRKLFYRKPPDGLLEICDQVFVFDCCFSTDAWEEQAYKVYMGGVVRQLHEHFPEASFLVFNFREVGTHSLMADVLSEYDMTIMDYPRHYEGCPLLSMEVMHHFLRSSESWLSLGPNNLLLMHCERGAWPVLAFILAALLIYRKHYSGEQKTLDMIYKQAPRELLHFLSPLNPVPSQLRYLQYVSRRNLVSEWPPLHRALSMDCVIMRSIPDFDGEGGCRPIFRIYGQDPFLVDDKTPKLLHSSPKRGKHLRLYKQAESELVKIDINCHVQGDVVVECLSLNDDLEKEVMMFRVVFNTAFIRSNILMLNRDEVDILWDAKELFPKSFRVELLFSEMDAASSVASVDFSDLEEKDGLPVEAFSTVHEIFSNVDWVDHTDATLNMLQHLGIANAAQENSDGNYNLSVATSPRWEGLSPKMQLLSPKMQRLSPKRICEIVRHAVLENNAQARLSSGLEVESFASPKKSPRKGVNTKLIAKDLHAVLPLTTQANTMSQQANELLPQESPSLTLNHPGATVKPLSDGTECSENTEVTHPRTTPNAIDPDEGVSSTAESGKRTDVSVLTSTPLPPPLAQPSSTSKELPSPPLPPSLAAVAEPSKQSEHSLIRQPAVCLQDSVQAPLPSSTFHPKTPSGATSAALPSSGRVPSTLPPASSPPPPPSPPPTIPLSEKASNISTSPCIPPPPPLPVLTNNSLPNSCDVVSVLAQPPIPPAMPHLNGNPVDRVAPPTPPPPPPPPPLGNSTGPTVSSMPKPPRPPPPPVSSHTGAPSVPPPPPAPGNSTGPTVSSMPKPPPPPPPPVSSHTGAPSASPPPPPPQLSSGKVAPNMGTNSSPSAPAPPFGPPSSVKGRMLRSVNSRSHQTKRLKPLHWLKLTRAVQGSLWAETQKSGEAAKAPEIDMTELESLFSASAPNTEHGRKSKLNKSCLPKSEKVQLIEHRRASNCEIMLSKVKVPLQDLTNSVLNLEESALDADQVENLIKFCPTKEEMELLKVYTGNKDKLGKCEMFFLEMMKVPRVEMKLRVFLFKMQFESQVSDLRNSLGIVNSAAEQIKNSVKFKRIMQTILSLGNALNQGTARGAAIGFRLDSLLKLSETRGRNNRITLMHYLCKVLAEKLPEVLDFGKDLACLEPATKVQLKFLAEEMQAINKGLEKVVQELSLSENDGPISYNFQKILKQFLNFAEGEVRSLASLYSGVGRNVDALILYFGEDPAKCPFEQVVSTLLNFVRLFNRAHEENAKQLENEMKKAAENEKSKTMEASDKESNMSPKMVGQSVVAKKPAL